MKGWKRTIKYICTIWIYPTGNLDSKSSRDVMDLLIRASRNYRQTILMITHNDNLASDADRVFRVTDGRLKDMGGRAHEKLS